MADEEKEPGLLDKALDYVRGKSYAKPPDKNKKPFMQQDPDKVKSFQDSFRKATGYEEE